MLLVLRINNQDKLTVAAKKKRGPKTDVDNNSEQCVESCGANAAEMLINHFFASPSQVSGLLWLQ